MSDTEWLGSPMLGNTFKDFVDYLREVDTPGLLLSPRLFCQALVHRNTVARAPGSRGIQADDLLRYVASLEAGVAG